MKKIKLYITAIISFFFLTTSCSLDEENKSSQPIGDYLKGDAQFEEFTTQVYSDMRHLLRNTNPMWYGTDIYEYTGVVGSWDYKINNYTLMDNNECYSWWNDNFKIITKANTALDRGKGVATPDLYDRRKAELLCLRAYSYFNLVETFGDVPLILNDLSDNPIYEIERTSEEIIFKQIINDLKTVLESNLLASNPNSGNEFGRIGTGMASHLLAKVLLSRSYKSFSEPTDITESIKFAENTLSLHPMVNNWDILFGTEFYSNINSEVIFSIRYSSNQELNGGWGNNLYRHFKPEFDKFAGGSKGAPYWGRDWSYQPTEFMLSLYDENDIRGSIKYIHRTINATADATINVDGADLMIKVGDPIIHFPREKWSEAEKNAYKAQYPTVLYVVNPDETHTYIHNSNTAYPVIFKFFDPGVSVYASDNDDPKGTRDTYVFRSAETKLLLAEAYVKLGDGARAKDLINDIRNRADADPLTTNATLDDVLDESARELFGETNRWMELRRSNKLLTRAQKHNAWVKFYHPSGNIPEYYNTRPIPEDERRLSKGILTQNPGYIDYINN